MKGLRVHHKIESVYTTGWQQDESVYNRKFTMWSSYDGHFGNEDYDIVPYRSEYLPDRIQEREQRRTAYMDRWNAKFQ